MTEQNKSVYRDGLSVIDYRQQIASFVTEATNVGLNVPLEHLHITSEKDRVKAVAEVSTGLGSFFTDYIDMLPEDVEQELLDEVIESAYRLVDLFLVKGEYEILRGAEPVSVLHALMTVLMIASLEGINPVSDYSLGSTANALFLALNEQDCKDPVFLYHKVRYMASVDEDDEEEEGTY